MTGIILDSILMLLLVAALGYGVRLEKKLTQLRAGQLAFAGAVTELNAACGRAENALASLRSSGEDADMLHDRIIKGRQLKQELETLIARAGRGAPLPPLHGEGPRAEASAGGAHYSEPATSGPTRAPASPPPSLPMKGRESSDAPLPSAPDPDDRAFRMAALAERINGLKTPAAAAAGAGNVQAILHALTANQSAKQSLNRAKASLDDDLFAA